MKILALADVHGSINELRKILDEVGVEEGQAPKYDLIVFVGDVTDFGPADSARQIVQELKTRGMVYVLPGNCDPPEVNGVLEEEGVSLHGKKESFGEYVFYGVGGSNPTPFNSPMELAEVEIKGKLLGVGVQGNKSVMVVHAPPKDTVCDGAPDGSHYGSSAVREAVEQLKPLVVVCGHIHEGKGEDRIGESLVVNPGAASHGHYAIIDVDQKSVQFFQTKRGVVENEEGQTSQKQGS